MVKTTRLSKREIGPWTNFESYLMKSENIHTGWIDWMDSRSFRLRKNPFIKHPTSRYIYLLPDEVKIPDEEALVRLKVEKVVKNIKLPRTKIFGTYTDQACIVGGYEPLKQDELPKPRLTKKEFLYELTRNWAGEEKEFFGKEIALNILSCPKSSYGIGGIGAQSLAPYGSKKDLINLNTSIRKLLPTDFLGRNQTYMYKPIRTRNDAEQTNHEFNLGASSEISYNYLLVLNPQLERSMLPTQIPVIIPDAKYQSDKWGLDRDILDFHMGALLFNPYIEESFQSKIVDVVMIVAKDMLRKSSLQLPINNSGMIRLANAWCRLGLKQSINEDDFPSMKNDLEPIFREYFDMMEDVQRTGTTFNIPLTRTTARRSFTLYANRIYKEIKKLARETSMKRLPRSGIRASVLQKEISNYDFDRALRELVNAGYLLTYKNDTEFEIVKIEF